MQEHAPTRSIDERLEQFERLGTIDLHVDYLRAGKGEYLRVTGHSLRTGRRIGVSRIEVTDGSGVLLAVGIGLYIIS